MGITKKILKYLPDKPTEGDTEYDGIFSYAGEWHSGIMGLGVGLTGSRELMTLLVGAALDEQSTCGDSMNPIARGEVRKEPWYAIGSMAVGYGIHLQIRLYEYYPMIWEVFASL